MFSARVELCFATETTYSTSSQSLESVKRVSYEVPAVAVLAVQRTVGLSRGRDGAGWAKKKSCTITTAIECQFSRLLKALANQPTESLPGRVVTNAQRLDGSIRLSFKRHELLLDDAAPVVIAAQRC